MRQVLPLYILFLLSPTCNAQAKHYLYVAEQSNRSIEGFSIAPDTGELVRIPGSPFFESGDPKVLVTNQAGTFLFVLNEWASNIAVFSISSSTGALQEIPNSPFPVINARQPSAMAISPDGSNLDVESTFSKTGSGGTADGFMVDHDGSLFHAESLEVAFTSPGGVSGYGDAHFLNFNESLVLTGQRLLTNYGAYLLNENGVLTPNSKTPASASDRFLFEGTKGQPIKLAAVPTAFAQAITGRTLLPNPDMTITPMAQTGASGQTYKFEISTTDFPAPPILSASCTIPQGDCEISPGPVLLVTTPATPPGDYPIRVVATGSDSVITARVILTIK